MANCSTSTQKQQTAWVVTMQGTAGQAILGHGGTMCGHTLCMKLQASCAGQVLKPAACRPLSRCPHKTHAVTAGVEAAALLQ